VAQEDHTSGTEGSPRPSLTQYIEENHKLITVLGVFTALTVFARSLPITTLGLFLSFLFMTLAVFVWLELFARFPSKAGGWRVTWFENILSLSVFMLVIYWILDYRQVWSQVLIIPVFGMLMGAISFLLKRFDVFNRLFRSQPDEKRALRYVFGIAIVAIAFFLSALVVSPLNHLLDHLASWMAIPPPE